MNKSKSSDNHDITGESGDNQPIECPICNDYRSDNWKSVRSHALSSHSTNFSQEELESGNIPSSKLGEEKIKDKKESSTPRRGGGTNESKDRRGKKTDRTDRKRYSSDEVQILYEHLNDNLDRAKSVERICEHFDRKNKPPTTSELTEIILEVPSGVKNRRIARMIAEEYQDELGFSKLDKRDFGKRRRPSRRSVSPNRGGNSGGVMQVLKLFQQMQDSNGANNRKLEKLEEKIEKEREKRTEEKEKRHKEEIKRLEDKIENSKKVGMTREDLYAKLSSDIKEIGTRFLGMRGKFLGISPPKEEIPKKEKVEGSREGVKEELPEEYIAE